MVNEREEQREEKRGTGIIVMTVLLHVVHCMQYIHNYQPHMVQLYTDMSDTYAYAHIHAGMHTPGGIFPHSLSHPSQHPLSAPPQLHHWLMRITIMLTRTVPSIPMDACVIINVR